MTQIVQLLLLFIIFSDCIHAKNDCIHGKATINITIDNINGNDSSDCLNNLKACKTLDYALINISHQECQNKSLFISIHSGTYDYSLDASNTALQFWNYSSISIVGKGKDVSVIRCNKSGAGFAFFHSLEVVVQDISIESCGSNQKGTSYNSTSKTVSDVSAALYFAFCQDVSIIRSAIKNSTNIGMVIYNTNRTLNVINSTFLYNYIKDNNTVGGGGFYAEFTYCDPGFATNCTQPSCSGVNYTFKGSNFSYNAASDGSEKYNTFIRASGADNIAFGRGGGISLIFKGNVNNTDVSISKCNIISNTATWGAGLFIEFQDKSNHNKVLVKDTKLDSNSCELTSEDNDGTGGGGARIGFISFTPNSVEFNTITFDNCMFTNNDAYWGGGLSYYTFREGNTIDATNNVNFTRCLWNKNRAVLGSAIDLSVWHPIKTGVLSKVLFSDCEFIGNVNERTKNKTYYKASSLGTGAFYSDSIPVAFQNSVYFQNNNGSAMALSATSATFNQGCESYFLYNHGWTGGAIALLGNAWLEIHEQTNFIFHNNSAILNGGAISVVISSRHDLLSSRNCFLQYYNQFIGPQNWSTHFNFFGNIAPYGHGPSIFATSLLSCVWGNSTGNLINGKSVSPFINWTIFNTSGNISEEISTEIANIVISDDVTVAPGQLKTLPLHFKDDFNKSVSHSVYLLPDKHQKFSVESNLTADNNVTFYGSPPHRFDLQIVSDNPRIVSTTIRVNLTSCPPGYVWLSPSGSPSDGRCRCGYEIKQSWDGILNCNDDEFRAYIETDYWAGYMSPITCNNTYIEQPLYTGKCPKNYCSTSGITLPSAQNLTKSICGNQNRTGILCGECLDDNYCVAINSRYYTCTRNVHKYNWAIWLATEYLPSTVLLVVILFYDINLHSESLGSVVMYFQVYSALNIYSDGKISLPKHIYAINKIINFLYNIWNLEYIGIWLSPYCLAKNLNTMQVLMISYISGFYPFLLIFIYVLFGILKRFTCCNPFVNFCIRLRWRTSLRASIINGLSTFWTLAYTKLALVSCLTLTIGYLQGRKDLHFPVEHVVSLQGSIGYFHKEHLPYAIPALVILVFFVILPSLALLCYPLTTRIMAKIKKFIDLDGNRFYAYISYKMERPFIRFKPLLDSFQGPYKQGCEFFAGLVYWYRLGIFFTYSFASGSKPLYINSVISILFVALISFFQPFKNAKNNTVMLLITTNITLINLISLYNYYEDISDFMSWFQLLLTILPMVYFAGCVVYAFKKKIQDYIRCAPPAGLYTNIPSQEFDDSLLHNMAEE